MPIHGEGEPKTIVKYANEIGYVGNSKYIWQACSNCSKERWVLLTKGQPQYYRCHKCATANRPKGKLSHAWRGGKHQISYGYIRVWLSPDDFCFPMTHDSRVFEHRLIMAKHLNRCLLPWEVVHHKNGIKDDNRIDNLQLLPSSEQHFPTIQWQNRIDQLEKRITLLEAENVLLKQEIVKGENCEHSWRI